MSRTNVAVLDFGSNHISVLIGDRGVNGTIDVRGFAQSSYSGFMKGQILEPELLSETLVDTILAAESNARCRITNLYIGVPAEFSIAEVRSKCLDFGKNKRISIKEIDQVFDEINEFNSSTSHIVVNRSPVCYELDTGEKIIEPLGMVSSKLCATISFMLCERNFVGIVSQAIEELEIPNVDFISESLAESLLLISPQERDCCSILVDCGYLTTSVNVVVGDGIVHMRSFSLGGGHIVADLSEILSIPFEVAEKVKRAISLTGRPNENDKMNIEFNEKIYTISSLTAYEIILRKVRQIAKMISRGLEDCDYERPDFIPINLTGGGISFIKGATEVLRDFLGKDIKIVAPDGLQTLEPTKSAVMGLLKLALEQTKTKNYFFIKIFKKHF